MGWRFEKVAYSAPRLGEVGGYVKFLCNITG